MTKAKVESFEDFYNRHLCNNSNNNYEELKEILKTYLKTIITEPRGKYFKRTPQQQKQMEDKFIRFCKDLSNT
ncbi:hypothetical protein K8R62_02665 [bacterium]|nr:hypothetical protein [bacterium]